MGNKQKRRWLVLSFSANIDADACSQHIDDKLGPLVEQGIEPILLTGYSGDKHSDYIQKRVIAISPSGLRHALRAFLKRHLKSRFMFKLFETPLLLLLLPFYILEKLIIDLEYSWSWHILASLKGRLMCRQYRPELIYATGGSPSAFLAAKRIADSCGLPWIAELQDPLIHDEEWKRSKRAFRYYTALELQIRRNADASIFMCEAALHNSNKRTGISERGYAIYPGVNEELMPIVEYRKTSKCHFSHFGSMGGTRNITILLAALEKLFNKAPEFADIIKIDLYGNCDSISEQLIADFPYPNLVKFHGLVPRKIALEKMVLSDCLLIIQNREFFATETIPAKIYDYFLSGRPIFCMIYRNDELRRLLQEGDHFFAPNDDVQLVANTVEEIVNLHKEELLITRKEKAKWTARRAVGELLPIADSIIESKKEGS